VIRVLICDDQLIVCEGLRTILSSDPEIQVIAVANDGQEALDQVKDRQPDLVLMDLKMPRMNGSIATRLIKEKYPQVYVLVLTTYEDDEWLFDAVRSGAAGYLLKDTPPEDLIAAVKGTVAGKSYIDPDVAGRILTGYAVHGAAAHGAGKLPTHYNFSEREKDVLRLLTQGLSNADIAEQLYITEGTVRNYTSEIFKKMGVSDRTQAAILALRYGLVEE
jgi:NarL family two-component system response regulator LiaR